MPDVCHAYLDLKEVLGHAVDLLETLRVRLTPRTREPGRHLPRFGLGLLRRGVLRLLGGWELWLGLRWRPRFGHSIHVRVLLAWYFNTRMMLALWPGWVELLWMMNGVSREVLLRRERQLSIFPGSCRGGVRTWECGAAAGATIHFGSTFHLLQETNPMANVKIPMAIMLRTAILSLAG